MRRPKVLIALITVAVLVVAGVTCQRAVAGPSPVASDAPLLGAPTASARLTPGTVLHVAESQGDGSLFAQAAHVTVTYGVWKPDLVRSGLTPPINVWVVTLTGLSTVPGPAGSALRSAPRRSEHNIAFIVDDENAEVLEVSAW